MDLEALRTAKFKKLDEAVTDWRQMRDKLDRLADDARRRLKGQAAKARWAGVNSDVTRPFIDKTAGEIEDAYTQASTVYNILNDTCAELTRYREQLESALTEADWQHVRVQDVGNGRFRVEAKKGADVSMPTLDRIRGDIERILTKATRSDSSAADALRMLADQDEYGFSDARYKDRDAAAKALRDGEQAAKLARDPSKGDELNRLLKSHRGDSLFAERFATKLGADRTLDYWRKVNDPDSGFRGDREALQKNLSMVLAEATQSDSPAMGRWEGAMLKAGPATAGSEPGSPSGFQVMSNLMRYGDYDDRFLKRYGSALVRVEKRRSDGGGGPGWDMDRAYSLNPAGPDRGLDPMTGYMKSLAHNPMAATEFFNDREGGDDAKSNFSYLFNDREWPQDFDANGDELHTGRNYMAQALAAGTTGVPAGEAIPKDLPPHDAGQAKLFEDVVHTVSKDPDKLKDHAYMSDSFGKMTAHYLPDINRAISDDQLGDTPLLYPVAGEQAKPSHQDVTRFLVTLGQNPEGNAAVELGQKQYVANLMDYHINPDLPVEDRYIQTSESPKEAIQRITQQSGEVSASLAVGRQEAVMGSAGEKDESFTHALAQGKNFVSGAIGTGVGIGTTFVASPVGGAAAGGAAGTASSMLLEEIFQANENKNKESDFYVAGGKWEESRMANTNMHQRAAELASEAHHSRHEKDVRDWARQGTTEGYDNAGANVNSFAGDLTTDF